MKNEGFEPPIYGLLQPKNEGFPWVPMVIYLIFLLIFQEHEGCGLEKPEPMDHCVMGGFPMGCDWPLPGAFFGPNQFSWKKKVTGTW